MVESLTTNIVSSPYSYLNQLQGNSQPAVNFTTDTTSNNTTNTTATAQYQASNIALNADVLTILQGIGGGGNDALGGLLGGSNDDSTGADPILSKLLEAYTSALATQPEFGGPERPEITKTLDVAPTAQVLSDYSNEINTGVTVGNTPGVNTDPLQQILKDYRSEAGINISA